MLLYEVPVLAKESNESDAHFARRNHRKLRRLFVKLLHDHPQHAYDFVQQLAGRARFPFDEVLPLLLEAELFDAFKLALETARSSQPHAGAIMEPDRLLALFLEVEDPSIRAEGLRALSGLTVNNPFKSGATAPLLESAYAMMRTLGDGPLSTSRQKRVMALGEEVISIVAKVNPTALRLFCIEHGSVPSENKLVGALLKKASQVFLQTELEGLASTLQKLASSSLPAFEGVIIDLREGIL